jgi:hypothetical protein
MSARVDYNSVVAAFANACKKSRLGLFYHGIETSDDMKSRSCNLWLIERPITLRRGTKPGVEDSELQRLLYRLTFGTEEATGIWDLERVLRCSSIESFLSARLKKRHDHWSSTGALRKPDHPIERSVVLNCLGKPPKAKINVLIEWGFYFFLSSPPGIGFCGAFGRLVLSRSVTRNVRGRQSDGPSGIVKCRTRKRLVDGL